MAVTTLFAFFLGLLHLWVGICGADDPGGEFFNENAFIYANPYLPANSTDNKVIIALASKEQCMSYIGSRDLDPTGVDPKELAACELHCNGFPYDTWAVSFWFLSGVGGISRCSRQSGRSPRLNLLGRETLTACMYSALRLPLTRTTSTGVLSSRMTTSTSGPLALACAGTRRIQRLQHRTAHPTP